ncbi:hypothetical protein ACFWNC_14705 [Streptomyces sp. NPDC058369]|uniref:hypothetical protein n=1 Tax=Streptomyces sp. NPDC058369 TaxID=3346462 RepID=UPI0036474836
MFKAEEIVLCTLSDTLVKTKCGPFTSAAASEESYLVEWTEGPDKGMCSIVWAQDLKSAPKFKKGDQVMRSGNSQVYEVAAGPFPDHVGDSFYVVVRNGAYDHVWEWNMDPVV